MNFVFVLVCICLLQSVVLSAKRIRIIPDSLELWTDNEILNVTYGLDRSDPHFNITWNVFKKIEDLETHVETTIKAKGDQEHYGVVNATYSICHLLSLKNAHPLAILAFQHLKRQGNLPDKCPIAKGTYTLKKMWPPEESIPTNLPMADMVVYMELRAVNGAESNFIGNCTIKLHSEMREGDAVNAKLPFLKG